jgi:Ca2+-transporting ATPase
MTGLTSAEAQKKLSEHGQNALPEQPRKSLWLRFLSQFQSPLIYLLLVALGLDLGVWFYESAIGVPFESLAIGAILLLNAGLGTLQEFRAEQALKEIGKMASPKAWVMRDGHFAQIPALEIVPGDVVRLDSGDRVPADGQVDHARAASLDESNLTGESVPVDKQRGEEVYSGTVLTRGSLTIEVTQTGPKSSLGKLAQTVGGIETSVTPLERRLREFGGKVTLWVGGLSIAMVVIGLVTEGIGEFERILFFAIALAVAAVPEGLPAVLTLTLALGVQRMSKQKAVVRRMAAVEALGSVSVIATDKTGTLTENQMTIERFDAEDEELALKAGVIANEAEWGEEAGDPVDRAFMTYAEVRELDVQVMLDHHPPQDTRPFDSTWAYQRTTVLENGTEFSYLKGSPEAALKASKLPEDERERLHQRAHAHAAEGFRVIGLAGGPGRDEKDLEFLGFALIWDPPRKEVPDAIKQCREAGIRVLMITGDHPETARAIASTVGIESEKVLTGKALGQMNAAQFKRAVQECSVFARVLPEDKLRIVTCLQELGETVAVTGDGVNDAPALKKADVGVAMGQRGSAVSREVSDLVLLDDNFATIVKAVQEGRNIFENIQKFLRFLFSTNVALVMLVFFGTLGSAFLGLRTDAGALLVPLTAIQLLWINFLGDGPPALALGFDKNPFVMQAKPRERAAPLFDPLSVKFVLWTGLAKGGVALAVLGYGYLQGWPPIQTITIVFLYETIAELLFVYPVRAVRGVSKVNWVLHGAVLAGIGIHLAGMFVPLLRDILQITLIPQEGWIATISSVLVSVLAAYMLALHLRRRYGTSS